MLLLVGVFVVPLAQAGPGSRAAKGADELELVRSELPPLPPDHDRIPRRPRMGTWGVPPEGLATLTDTKLTEVDLNGDGVADIERRFGADGRVIWSKTRLAAPEGVEVAEYQVSEGVPETRVTTVQVGASVVRKLTERYLPGGRLVDSALLWSSQPNGALDRRRVSAPHGTVWMRTKTYWLEGSTWTLKETRDEDLLPMDPPLDAYVTCLNQAATLVDAAACRAHLDSLARQIENGSFNYSNYSNLECRTGTDLFLPNGYRVDLSSCNTTAGVDAIRAGTRAVSNGMLACLHQVNPALATRFASSLAEKLPRISCGGDGTRFNYTARLPCNTGSDSDRASCLARVQDIRRRSGAFAPRDSSGDIVLTGDDPVSSSDIAGATDAETGQNENLGSTLFHETIHVCGHHGGAHHNDPDFADEVYGCQAVCGGGSDVITSEGCEACVKGYAAGADPRPTVAEGRNPSPSSQMIADCRANFPPARVILAFKNAENIHALLRACESARTAWHAHPTVGASSPDCDALNALPEVARVCGTERISLLQENSCDNALRVEAANLIRGVWAVSGRDRAVRAFISAPFARVGGGRIQSASISSGTGGELGADDQRSALLGGMVVDGFCTELSGNTAFQARSTNASAAFTAYTTLRSRYDANIRATPTRIDLSSTVVNYSAGTRTKTTWVQPVGNVGSYPVEGTATRRGASLENVAQYCGRFRSRTADAVFSAAGGLRGGG